MRVTLVTTWGIACGIAEMAFYLKEAIEGADRDIQIEVETNLHPDAALRDSAEAWGPLDPEWVILNYHAALHSQWTPEHVRAVQVRGGKVMVIFHDTGVPNSDQCKALHAVADCFVVHEPAEDLPGAVYLRQGIPAAEGPYQYGKADPKYPHASDCFKGWWQQPVVGSVGFPFPWKNYDLLAEASARAGWALMLLAPKATPEQVERWYHLNPWSTVLTEFMHRDGVLARLSGCDATAFLYANANTGTSAAIRLGVAARKPVIATSVGGCRQFRDLGLDPVGQSAISWLPKLDVESVAQALACVRPGAWDAGVVRLAHQDSWASVGERYACLLRGMR